MSVDRELEYIKLKVDWYKSAFPWTLAMVVGAVTFMGSINQNSPSRYLILTFVILSVVFLLGALLSTWYATLALIHRLEEPYRTNSKLLNRFLWVPHNAKWEAVFASAASVCLGAGQSAFVCALIFKTILE
jgi:hypothetical protein